MSVKRIWVTWITSLGILTTTFLLGCSLDTANEVVRAINANVSGVYRHDGSGNNDGVFVTANSGGRVISMDLRQAGDQLEGIDNNGIVFRGSVGSVSETSASFTLKGATTVGNGVTISGTIDIGGGLGTMRATWIEPTFFSTVYGVANGPSINTNQPPSGTNTNNNFFISLNHETYEQLADIRGYTTLALWFMDS